MAAIILGVAACATNEIEPASVTKAEDPVPASTPVTPEGVIDDVDVPTVPMSANSPGPAVRMDQREIVCHSERRTGSHRITRVCRTREEIEKTETTAKESFKELLDIQRTQGEY